MKTVKYLINKTLLDKNFTNNTNLIIESGLASTLRASSCKTTVVNKNVLNRSPLKDILACGSFKFPLTISFYKTKEDLIRSLFSFLPIKFSLIKVENFIVLNNKKYTLMLRSDFVFNSLRTIFLKQLNLLRILNN
jgi:hypothetical protein